VTPEDPFMRIMSEARYLIIEIMSEVVILFMTYSERQCAEFMTQLVQPDAQYDLTTSKPICSIYKAIMKTMWEDGG
jgi:hypothetical protein